MTDYLILINEEHKLPEGYEKTVELVRHINDTGDEQIVEKKTLDAFLRLKEDLMKKDGICAQITSSYRGVDEQIRIYKKYLDKFGIEYAEKYVAKPGHSEHHTGLAIDIAIKADGKWTETIEERFEHEDIFNIIQSKIADYGFILRYPKGKEDITKIGYESWHLRYIDSVEIAKEITDGNLCFEEYCEKN